MFWSHVKAGDVIKGLESLALTESPCQLEADHRAVSERYNAAQTFHDFVTDSLLGAAICVELPRIQQSVNGDLYQIITQRCRLFEDVSVTISSQFAGFFGRVAKDRLKSMMTLSRCASSQHAQCPPWA
jgi:hypothetical protein